MNRACPVAAKRERASPTRRAASSTRRPPKASTTYAALLAETRADDRPRRVLLEGAAESDLPVPRSMRDLLPMPGPVELATLPPA